MFSASASLFSSAKLAHAKQRFTPHGFLINQQIEQFLERLDVITRPFENIAVFGPPHPIALPFDYSLIEDVTAVEDQFDLILAPNLHQTEHMPVVLAALQSLLKPEGCFMGCLLGGDTLSTLRHVLLEADTATFGGAYPRLHPLVSAKTAASLLQGAGFKLPVADSTVLNVHYTSIKQLVTDIRENGDSNALQAYTAHYAGKAFWPDVETRFKHTKGTEDGLLPVAFDFIHLIGWKS